MVLEEWCRTGRTAHEAENRNQAGGAAQSPVVTRRVQDEVSSEDLRGLVHEVLNPLAVALSQVECLENAGCSSERLRSIKRSLERIRDRLVEALEERTSHGQNVFLKGLVAEVFGDLDPLMREKAVSWRIEGNDVALLSDGEMLFQIVFNLAKNAVEAEPHRGQIVVTLVGGPHVARVEMKNARARVADVEKAQLFRPHRSTKGNHRGVGLTVSMNLASTLGAALEYDEQRGFVLTIPRGKFIDTERSS